jgi:hypothetical protein
MPFNGISFEVSDIGSRRWQLMDLKRFAHIPDETLRKDARSLEENYYYGGPKENFEKAMVYKHILNLRKRWGIVVK